MREIKLVEITDEMKENQEKRKSLKDKDIDLLLSTEHLISESSCPEFPDNS